MAAADASTKAVWSTASSGDLNVLLPAASRCRRVFVVVAEQPSGPRPVPSRAFRRCASSAARAISRGRRSGRAWPPLLGEAPLLRQRMKPPVDIEPIERRRCRACRDVMPDGLIWEATTNGMSSCSGNSCSRASLQGEPVALRGDALAAQQAPDHADRLVLAVALDHRVDAEHVRSDARRRVPSRRSRGRPSCGRAARCAGRR